MAANSLFLSLISSSVIPRRPLNLTNCMYPYIYSTSFFLRLSLLKLISSVSLSICLSHSFALFLSFTFFQVKGTTIGEGTIYIISMLYLCAIYSSECSRILTNELNGSNNSNDFTSLAHLIVSGVKCKLKLNNGGENEFWEWVLSVSDRWRSK